LGQPKTPKTTSPFSIKAKHTAYWPPLKKPAVPSMGSTTCYFNRLGSPVKSKLKVFVVETNPEASSWATFMNTKVNRAHYFLLKSNKIDGQQSRCLIYFTRKKDNTTSVAPGGGAMELTMRTTFALMSPF